MIFLSVGTQLGFDRLIRCVDQWCATHPEVDAFAQIGAGEFEPTHMQWERNLDALAYAEKVEQATILVAHAGMGSLLTAIGVEKPLIMMPRKAEFGEHRNDHQLDAIDRVMRPMGVHVALIEEELVALLDRAGELGPPVQEGGADSRGNLVAGLRGALFGKASPSGHPPGATPGGSHPG